MERPDHLRIELALAAGLTLASVVVATGCFNWETTPGTDAQGVDGAEGDSGGADGSDGAGAGGSPTSGAGSGPPTTTSGSGATGNTGAGGSGAGGSLGGGGIPNGGQCDTGTCHECAFCAIEDECEAQAGACLQDVLCLAFADCLLSCGSGACIDQCVQSYPDGAIQFEDAISCVLCESCSFACADLGELVGCLGGG